MAMRNGSKHGRKTSHSTGVAVSKPFGYINEDDPFEDDARYELQSWWELVPEPGRQLTHEMMSEALWHALMGLAEQLRYKYIKSLPAMSDLNRQREGARSLIMKMQLLERLAMNWLDMKVLFSNPVNFTWLSKTIEGMQESYEKRYGCHRVY